MRNHFRNARRGSRYCYAKVDRLATALDNPKVLDQVLLSCGVGNKPEVLRRLPVEEKWEAIGAAFSRHKEQRASACYGVDELEQLAALMFGLDLPAAIRAQVWPKVKLEKDLLTPVARHFATAGFEVFKEIPMGKQRIDVLCRKPGGWLRGEHLVGVELKNDLSQLKRGLDQMTTFAGYAHAVYLACTPEMAASYLSSHLAGKGVRTWDAAALSSKLERVGLGLLIVEGNEAEEALAPRTETPRTGKTAELKPFLIPKNAVTQMVG